MYLMVVGFIGTFNFKDYFFPELQEGANILCLTCAFLSENKAVKG